MDRTRFMTTLKKRFSLRLHMTLILLATFIAGVLASKWMLIVGLHNVALRYPITVLFAYLVFFTAIKIWLWLITDAPTHSSNNTGNDILSNIDITIPSGSGPNPVFSGGGSRFDGGGASADFGDTASNATSGTGNALGDAIGDAVGAVADDEGGLVLAIVLGLLAALLSSVLGVGAILIWEAPAILAEAAFNAVLAASLVRSTTRINKPDWIGSVFTATWKPFAVVMVMALVSGWTMHHYLPEAKRIMDVVHMVW